MNISLSGAKHFTQQSTLAVGRKWQARYNFYMRLWSLHPTLLDSKGLVACWREGLLARKVLCGQTRGYRHHPQLRRFQAQKNPLGVLDAYLREIALHASTRGYHFDMHKLGNDFDPTRLTVTSGQLAYELAHLKAKLQLRAPTVYEQIATLASAAPHPIFVVIAGQVEGWEKLAGAESG